MNEIEPVPVNVTTQARPSGATGYRSRLHRGSTSVMVPVPEQHE